MMRNNPQQSAKGSNDVEGCLEMYKNVQNCKNLYDGGP